MRKMRKILAGLGATTLMLCSTMMVSAEEAADTTAIADSIEESQLGRLAVENEENIVLEDEEGYVLKEFHSDGYVAEFTYADTYSEESQKQLLSIADNDGKVQEISYDAEGNVAQIDVYADGEHVGTKDFAAPVPCNEEPMSDVEYYIFYVKISGVEKINMNNLISDAHFVRQSTSATQQDMQDLFDTTGSPLKNDIVVYEKKDGSIYNTGVTVTPAKVIYDASVTYSVSPKVILTTLQKESSLVSNKHIKDELSNTCFYFCMGAGSSKTKSFDQQIDLGTSTLHKWYQQGIDNYSFPYYYFNPGFHANGDIVGKEGGGIWCDNAATYSLYKYTPYTCYDVKIPHSANVLFLEIYNGEMLSNFPL